MNKALNDRMQEVSEIVSKYPRKVPATVVADFFGIEVESLRKSIEQKKCPFAIGWETIIEYSENYKTQKKYNAISTLAFAAFATGGNLEKVI